MRIVRSLLVCALFISGLALIPVGSASADAGCGVQCTNVDASPAKLAQELLNGNFSANNPEIISNEIAPIANGTLSDPRCDVDGRVLQTLVVVMRSFGQVRVNDLGRWCANDGYYQCESITGLPAPSPNHCATPDVAIDFGQVGSVSVDGSNARSMQLLGLLQQFMPDNMHVGQLQCRQSAGIGQLGGALSQEFNDTCNHLHIDFRFSSGGLRVTNPDPTAPTAPSQPPLPPANLQTIAYTNYYGHLAFNRPAAGTASPSSVTSEVATDVNMGVDRSTSPAIAALPNNQFVIAFRADIGGLYVWQSWTQSGIPLGLEIRPGTSPSVTGLDNGQYAIAFQTSDSHLHVYTYGVGQVDTGLTMRAGTSPSITRTSDGKWAVAFQAYNQHLYTVRQDQLSHDTGAVMLDGTNPAITSLTNANFATAFVGSSGVLNHYLSSNDIYSSLGLGVAPGGSPSITTLAGDSYVIAIRANTVGNDLYVFRSIDQFVDAIPIDAAENTSPGIVGLSATQYEVVFQGWDGVLGKWVLAAQNPYTNLGQGMAPGTSPSIRR